MRTAGLCIFFEVGSLSSLNLKANKEFCSRDADRAVPQKSVGQYGSAIRFE